MFPGSGRLRSANQRQEWRFYEFLDMCVVGRKMTDGMDEDNAHAQRMDGWVMWEMEERNEPRG